MKALSELIAHVKDIEAKRYALRGHWRELGEIAPLLAKIVEKLIEELQNHTKETTGYYSCRCTGDSYDVRELLKEIEDIIAKGMGKK